MRVTARKFLCWTIIVGAVAFVILAAHELAQSLSLICPDQEAKHLLQNLCILYRNRFVDGNLCADLCNTGTLRYVSCYNYHRGKAVFFASWNDVPVILKSKFGEMSDYPKPFATIVDGVGNTRTATPDLGLFSTMVYHHVRGQFGFNLKLTRDDLLRRMWPGGHGPRGQEAEEQGMTLTEPEMVSLWALLQQEEFVTFQFWKGFRHYPRVYGSCGHFYALESVPPGDILYPPVTSVRGQLASFPWPHRARVALSLMELVAAMDDAFPEKLHLCDVKHDNFGVGVDLVVKAIDVDISFFQNQLDITLPQPGCMQDEECHFFDCKGSCNRTTSKCNSQRANTNLQAVCADIFIRHYGAQGLLRLPPTQVARQLDSALEDCVGQKGLPPDTKVSQTAVFQRLVELLEASLKYVQS